MTHTPTPWKTGNAFDCARDHAISADGNLIARVMGNGYPIGTGWSPESAANADLIVRAVNAHDALVAALEAITGMVEAYAGHPMSNDKRTKDARAALAAAKG